LFNDLIYLVPFHFLNIDIDNFSNTYKVLCSLFSSLILAIIIFLIYRKYLIKKFKEFIKNFGDSFDIGMKLWFIGLVGMCVTNLLIGTFTPVKEANNEVLVQEMLNKTPILTFISASLFAPFLEEMLFRKSFGDIFKNKKIMVIASGLVFGLLHVIFSMQTPYDLLYVIPYGLLGSSFAYMIYKKDNVFIPMFFHMLHNGALTLLSILLGL
jgi:membrane protease YdiL (CAAX protease family)